MSKEKEYSSDLAVVMKYVNKTGKRKVDKIIDTGYISGGVGKPPKKMVLVQFKPTYVPLSHIGPAIQEDILTIAEEEVKILGFIEEPKMASGFLMDKVFLRVEKTNTVTGQSKVVTMNYADVKRLYMQEMITFYEKLAEHKMIKRN